MNNYGSILGKGIDKIIQGAADGPIKTLNSTWDLIFGGYHNWVAKIQYKRELDLTDFKANIESKVKRYLIIIYKNLNFQ